MARWNTRCPDVTIPVGTAVSNIIASNVVYDDASLIALFAPAVLDAAHVYNLEVSEDITVAVPLWYTMNTGAADIVAPAVTKSVQFATPLSAGFRIHDITGNVAADRTWKMFKTAEIY